MTDQILQLANDGGSKERVEFAPMEKIHHHLKEQLPTDKQSIINLYVDCLATTNGDRNGWK